MVIEANKAVLLIRYNNYKKTDFILEHNKIVSDKGYVWMLKAGRKLVESKLLKVINETGVVILKAPKNSGGNYYYAKIQDYRFGIQSRDMISPDYYKILVDDESLWQIESLDGTWLKIGEIKPLSINVIERFKLISNGKKVDDVIRSTMSSTLYIQNDRDTTL